MKKRWGVSPSAKGEASRDMFQIGSTMSIDDTFQQCTALNPSSGMATVIDSWMGAAWCVGDMSSTNYNHVAGPNSTTCTSMSGMMMGGADIHGQRFGPDTAVERASWWSQSPPGRWIGAVHQEHHRPQCLACSGHAQRRRDHQLVGFLTPAVSVSRKMHDRAIEHDGDSSPVTFPLEQFAGGSQRYKRIVKGSSPPRPA